ncbi:MAG: 4Fe-4S dicluster domain-containing protein [Rectinemataceae bacterium]
MKAIPTKAKPMGAPTAGLEANPAVLDLVRRRRKLVTLSLGACAHCALCAQSCFKYRNSGQDPTYTPSYKAINTIGKIVKRRGRLSPVEYGEIRELAFDKCVLCMRCRCPVGVDLPYLISLARSACREAGLERGYREGKNE